MLSSLSPFRLPQLAADAKNRLSAAFTMKTLIVNGMQMAGKRIPFPRRGRMTAYDKHFSR